MIDTGHYLRIRKTLNTQEADTGICLRRQKLREHKKSRIRGMSQEELQQRLEQLMEQMK